MAVKKYFRLFSMLFFAALLSGCAVSQSEAIIKIALLAPFEGRNRDIGYDALYAARLAIHEHDNNRIELLAVDDGGTPETARQRVIALQNDPTVQGLLMLGQSAAQAEVQAAVEDLPALIVGYWGTPHSDDSVLMLASAELTDRVSTDSSLYDIAALDNPITAGDWLAQPQTPQLTNQVNRITIVSSGSLPGADFKERYLNSDLYVPEPGVLATLTYDAAGLLITAIERDATLSTLEYEGINGIIQFDEGYWAQAPIHRYQFVAGELQPID